MTNALWLPPKRRLWHPPPECERTPIGVFGAGGGILPPVMTWTSAANITTPVFGIATPATALTGNLIQVQASQSSGFSAPEYDDTHELSAGEISGLAYAPLVGPLVPGLWYGRSRWNQGSGWSAWSNTVSLTINTYVGLGDVRSTGFLGGWGCQAIAAAYVGNNCLELRRASDNTLQAFTIQADGRLDHAAIAAFRDGAGASTVHVKTCYGQGIACNLVQATNSKQPEFVLDQPVGWGSMKFVRASGQYLEGVSSGIASAQPYHMMVACKRISAFTSFHVSFELQSSSGLVRLAGSNVNNNYGAYTGSGSVLSNTDGGDNVWNIFQTTFNNTSSATDMNGHTLSSGTTSADTLVTGVVRLGCQVDGTEHWDGYLSEACVWSGDPGANGRRDLAGNALTRLVTGY